MSQPIFEQVAARLAQQGLKVVSTDFQRPWGGFFVLDESQIHEFASLYFPHLAGHLPDNQKLSPKILVVGPQNRLSWQYHFRRAEVWRVVEGPVGVATSETDAETRPQVYTQGEVITLKCGERHRLVGLGDWGVVAEIWQHTDPASPSDESDIVRLQDDYARN
jgi:mannose-6-phosphate isomerase